jgi:hypothetical protein
MLTRRAAQQNHLKTENENCCLPTTVWLTASARLEKATGSAILRGDAAKKGQGIMAVVGYARVSTEDQSTEGADPGSSEVQLH